MKSLLASTLAIALLSAAVGAPSAAPSGAGRTYLVLPYENVAEEPSLDWLSTCLAFTLGEYLKGTGSRVVDDEERAVLYEGSGLPAGAPLMLASAIQLGRKMRSRSSASRPDRLVLGRFLVTDGALTISARSIDLEGEKARPWVSREGRLTDLLQLQNRVALELLDDDGIPIRGSRASILERHSGDVPLLAFETYCRAMAETDSKDRLRLLRRAVRERPGYPKALYQAARILVRSERWSEAATMLDGASAEPHPYEKDFHLLRATVALEQDDPGKAAEAARNALRYADTPRGHVLLARALLATGERDAARAEMEAAEALDPNAPGLDRLRQALSDNTTE